MTSAAYLPSWIGSRMLSRPWPLFLLRLDLVIAQGVADDAWERFRQAVDFGVDFTIQGVDLAFQTIKPLLGLLLERKQLLVYILDLLRQESNEPSSSPTRRLRSRISASTFMAILYL